MAKNLEILCPCCESTLVVDPVSGEVLLHSQKDRGRILEERFREALERADKDDKPPVNPFDLD